VVVVDRSVACSRRVTPRLDGIGPEALTPLDERDAPLGHEPAGVADLHAEVLSDRSDVEKMR
jgi:hypothetical protein